MNAKSETASDVKPFGKSYPLNFKLYNNNNQEVLYIDDIATGHPISLEITNTSKQDIVLPQTADSSHWLFELRFRPGILHNPEQITLSDDNWSMSSPKTDTNGTVSFSILSKTEQTLTSSELIKLPLQKVCANGGEGSRGTQVELKYQQLYYTGRKDTPIVGTRIQYLNLINRRGGKYLPLHVGFVGSNVVLNDGSTSNELQLRITNIGTEEVTLTTASRFVISFDVGTKNTKPWAIGTADEVEKIIEVVSNEERWTVESPKGQSQNPEWVITLKAGMSISPSQNMTLSIKNIITAHPTGHTNIYINYENIPGYWDGQFICVIEKSPLLTRGEKVGIGVSPKAENGVISGIGVVPIGAVIDWYPPPKNRSTEGLNIPPGYKLCDGTEVTDQNSPLYQQKVPNLAGLFIKGTTSAAEVKDGLHIATDITVKSKISGKHKHELPEATGCITNLGTEKSPEWANKCYTTNNSEWGWGVSCYKEATNGNMFISTGWDEDGMAGNGQHSHELGQHTLTVDGHTHEITIPSSDLEPSYYSLVKIIRIK